MKVDGINLQTNLPGTQTIENKQQVIDEAAIKTILYLGLKGEIKLEPIDAHAVDTFA
jgi:hypothetical protein